MWVDRIMARRGMTWDKLIIEHLESRGIEGAFYQDWSRHVGGFVSVRGYVMIYSISGFYAIDPIGEKGFTWVGKMEDPDFLDNLDKALEYHNVELLYE